MAHQVVDGLLENQEDVAPHLRPEPQVLLEVGGVKAKLDVAAGEDVARKPRMRRVRSRKLSRFGLIAQTMSLIAATDSREMWAMEVNGPPLDRPAAPSCC